MNNNSYATKIHYGISTEQDMKQYQYMQAKQTIRLQHYVTKEHEELTQKCQHIKAFI